MSHTFIHIIAGKPENPAALVELFKGLKDGKYKIEPKNANARSLSQNDYYWMMVEIVQHALYDAGWEWIRTKEDAHRYLADRFLRVSEVNVKTGEIYTRVRSTTELSTTEMNQYYEDIWQFASQELGVVIEAPNKQRKIF